jgi:hypothetical protein
MAIPLVLVLIVLLSVLAAAALTVVGLERRTIGSSGLQADAYTIARSGLDRFISSRAQLGFMAIPPAPVESTRIALANGYADVVLTRVRIAQGLEPALYVIRSRGIRTDGSAARVPIAFRTVAQVARWQDPTMQVLSSWTSLRGVAWRNAAGELNGNDACGAAATVAGVATPDAPGFTQASGPPVPNGLPDALRLGPSATAPDSVRIDWTRLRTGGVVSSEVSIPPDAWPSPAQWADPNYWPVIIVQGNLTLPTDGRGLLVVTGDLALTGGKWWRGVVLVGGRVGERGGNRVQGALVSGLDRKLGGTGVPVDSVWGAFRVQYDSCNVARALSEFRGLAAYRNATVDNVP